MADERDDTAPIRSEPQWGDTYQPSAFVPDDTEPIPSAMPGNCCTCGAEDEPLYLVIYRESDRRIAEALDEDRVPIIGWAPVPPDYREELRP